MFFKAPGKKLAILSLQLLLLPLVAWGQPKLATPGTGLARDVISEEALQKEVAKTRKVGESFKDMALPLTAPRPSLEHNLYSRSIILYDGKFHTVLPFGAILSLPPEYQGHVVSTPTGDFTYWPDFKAKNTSWLEGYEVPLKMAQGDEGEARKVLKEIKDNPKVLVSLYKNCPISILEPVAPSKPSPSAKPPVIGQSSH